jgi:hypothetical protein
MAALGWVALVASLLWIGLTARFFLQRMKGNSTAWPHVLEMAATSVAIPPIALFWRLQGAWRYRVPFL